MPHVVLSGEVNAELIFEKLDNIFEKTSGGILRTTNHFLDINKKEYTDAFKIKKPGKGIKIYKDYLIVGFEDGSKIEASPKQEILKDKLS